MAPTMAGEGAIRRLHKKSPSTLTKHMKKSPSTLTNNTKN